jgi:hypothetical protein
LNQSSVNPRYSREESEIEVLRELPGGWGLENIEFGLEDMVKISIKELATFSAPAPNGIPAVLLKKCVGTLEAPLAMLWKASMM